MFKRLVELLRLQKSATRLVCMNALLMVFFPTPSFACSCAFPNTDEELRAAVSRSLDSTGTAAIFVATVNAVESENGWLLKATVTPKHWWKGRAHGKVTVETPVESVACGVPFKVGMDYLIHATSNDASGNWEADSCNTQPANTDEAAREIEMLKRLAQ